MRGIIVPGRKAIAESLVAVETGCRRVELTNLPRVSPWGRRAPPHHLRPRPPLLPRPPPRRARPWTRSGPRSPPPIRQRSINAIRKTLYALPTTTRRN